MIQRLLPIALTVLLLGATGALVGFALSEEAEIVYSGLDVEVEEVKGSDLHHLLEERREDIGRNDPGLLVGRVLQGPMKGCKFVLCYFGQL